MALYPDTELWKAIPVAKLRAICDEIERVHPDAALTVNGVDNLAVVRIHPDHTHDYLGWVDIAEDEVDLFALQQGAQP